MKIRIKRNYNNDDLWCVFSKERIQVDEKYIEVTEDVLDEEIIKTYAFDQLETLSSEFVEIYDREPDILFGEE